MLVDPVCRAEWREAGEPRKRMLARGVILSRRGEFLARMGVVRFALKLLMSGSRTISKFLARMSAGRGAGVAERLTGEVRKIAAGALARGGGSLERSPLFSDDGRFSENLRSASRRSTKPVRWAICRW